MHKRTANIREARAILESTFANVIATQMGNFVGVMYLWRFEFGKTIDPTVG